MKTSKDPLNAYFDTLRSKSRMPDDGFTERVMDRVAIPPSRNSYRIPVLATSLASLALVLLVAFTPMNERVGQLVWRTQQRIENYRIEWKWDLNRDLLLLDSFKREASIL